MGDMVCRWNRRGIYMLGRTLLVGKLGLALAVAVMLPTEAPSGTPGTPDVVELRFKAGGEVGRDTRQLLTSPEVDFDPTDGSYRLANSVLLTHETGATDFHQAELLSERVQAKKEFVLDNANVHGAELFLFGFAKEISVNGKPLPAVEPLKSTGWSRVKVPANLLQAGVNTFVFRGGGHLLLEPGKAGRSFKSDDGGTTWSNRALGRNSNQEGEYLLRLRLERRAAAGWVMTQVFDLWKEGGAGSLVKVRGLSLEEPLGKQPAGTQLTPWLRTGETPQPDGKHWTAWQKIDKDLVPAATQQRHRWAQLKFDLATTKPQLSPRVPAAFMLVIEQRADVVPAWKGTVKVSHNPEQRLAVAGSVPFVYQEPSPRLKLLRERYKLDEVIAPGKTELEQLMLLRYWVRNQWHTAWGNHPQPWMPPWDAHIILESKDQPDCLTMCTHYAAVFTQCCLALGWNARHCILDHHCVAEVFVNEKARWVMMDAGNSAQRGDVGLHFEDDGMPMSALELHHLQQGKRKGDKVMVRFTPKQLSDKITHLCRPAPATKEKYPPRPDSVPLAELKNYPVCGLENYRRYAMPPRNNYLSSLLPGELYQGWSEYFFDGYYWIGDSRHQPTVSPEYSLHLYRPMDIDWPLNWCRLHAIPTDKPHQYRIDIETMTPNLARLEMKMSSAKDWQPTPATLTWTLQPGENLLEVRSVNAWGKAGPVAQMRVQWQPGT
jgi:hypothetical protein